MVTEFLVGLSALIGIVAELGNVSAAIKNKALNKQIKDLQDKISNRTISYTRAVNETNNIISRLATFARSVDSRVAHVVENAIDDANSKLAKLSSEHSAEIEGYNQQLAEKQSEVASNTGGIGQLVMDIASYDPSKHKSSGFYDFNKVDTSIGGNRDVS